MVAMTDTVWGHPGILKITHPLFGQLLESSVVLNLFLTLHAER